MAPLPDSLRSIFEASKKTPRDALKASAFEQGYIPFDAMKKYGESALMLVPKDFGPSVNRSLLVCFPRKYKGAALFRALEERGAIGLYADIKAIERIANIKCFYLSSAEAINASGKSRMPGGDFAWWEFCTNESLRTWESLLGSFTLKRPVRRVRIELHRATLEVEQKPKSPSYPRSRKVLRHPHNFPRLRT